MSLVSAKEIRTFVLNYLSERADKMDLNDMQINDSFDFLKPGIIDSLGVIEMIAAIEKHFKLTIDFEQMDPEEFTILESFSCFVAERAKADVR